MLDGHFKIGSHGEYSSAEKAGLLSDNSEGKGSTSIFGGKSSFTGKIGEAIFENVWFENNATDIHIEEKVDSLIFCSSVGEYESGRHKKIMSGDISLGYEPNDQTTAFLTLDAEKLAIALKIATDEFFGVATIWTHEKVEYLERDRRIHFDSFTGLTKSDISHRLIEQAYLKPPKFQIEEEYRFLLLPPAGLDIPKNLFTNSLTTAVQDAFRSAIVSKGGDYPDSTEKPLDNL